LDALTSSVGTQGLTGLFGDTLEETAS
jgi:hypothetical protein